MYLFLFPNRDYAVGAVSGVAASLAAVFIMHPVESVKVRMQSGQRGGAVDETPWRRLRGLFHRPYYGIGPHLLQYSALNSIRFGSYAAAKGYLERRHGHGFVGPLPLHEIFQCGVFSGFCIAALVHPMWVLKTHQQINRLGVAEAACRLWQGEGVRGFFRGYVSGFVRFPVALGVFFAAYEAMKRPETWTLLGDAPRPRQSEPPDKAGALAPSMAAEWLSKAGSGAFAGVLCWSSIYPLDVVQSRVIGEATYGPGRLYSGALRTFHQMYKTEGLSSFARGYSAVLVRSGPVNAVLLPVSDAAIPIVRSFLPED